MVKLNETNEQLSAQSQNLANIANSKWMNYAAIAAAAVLIIAAIMAFMGGSNEGSAPSDTTASLPSSGSCMPGSSNCLSICSGKTGQQPCRKNPDGSIQYCDCDSGFN